MLESVLIPKALRSSKDKDKFYSAGHAKYLHLHFDLHGDADEIERGMDRLREGSKSRISWENFEDPDSIDIEKLVNSDLAGRYDHDYSIILNRAHLGSPAFHLTSKYNGVAYGDRYNSFIDLYHDSIRHIDNIGARGYLELEDVYSRTVFLPQGSLNFDLDESDIGQVGHFDKSPVANLGRKFRTTEIHVSFDDISKVHPVVLSSMLKSGFCSAFKKDLRFDKMSFIATIQGYDPDIAHIELLSSRWINHLFNLGAIECEVVIKKEDILGFATFGSETGVQDVVVPGTTNALIQPIL